VTARIVDLRKGILEKNDLLAEALRGRFTEAGVRVSNWVSSPGTGKTALLESLLTTAVENALVPAESWGQFSEKGGLRGSMDFLPIEQFANTIVQLSQRKAQVERDL